MVAPDLQSSIVRRAGMDTDYTLTLECGHTYVFARTMADTKTVCCTKCMKEDGVDLWNPPADWQQRYRRKVGKRKPGRCTVTLKCGHQFTFPAAAAVDIHEMWCVECMKKDCR